MNSHPLHFDAVRCAGRWHGVAMDMQCKNCQRREPPPPFHHVSWFDRPPKPVDGQCPQKIEL